MPDFLDIRFPTEISYGSVGGSKYATRILTAASGNEQRISLYDTALLEWRFDRRVWNEEEVNRLINFWHVVGGKQYAFRFKDWSDYYVGMVRTNTGLTFSGGTPHVFAEGDGAETEFQLARVYEFESFTRSRKITRPVSPIKVYVDGVEQTSGLTVDCDTGLLTFSVAPGNGLEIAFAGEYDWPARFATDSPNLTLSGVMQGNLGGLSVIGVRE